MITTHIQGTMIEATFSASYYDVESFDFDGQDDANTEQLIKDAYYDMKNNGFVNVCIMTEDSQVPEDCVALRHGKPYMLIGSGYPTPYVADMSCDEIERCWN